MATIQGHRRYLEAKTDEERLNYASTAHYSDYRILAADGNIDGRQGIRLGMSGVELLEVFKPKPRRKKKMTTETETQDETHPKQEGKNVPISVDRPTFNREMALKARLGHKSHTQTVTFLLNFYEQGGSAQGSIADTIRAVLVQDPGYQKLRQAEETASAASILEAAPG